MSGDDHVLADSDLYVFELPDLWQRHIDPIFEHAVPGWKAAEAEIPSVKDIRDYLEAIRWTEGFEIPTNAAQA